MTQPPTPSTPALAHNDALTASVAKVREADVRQVTAFLELALARLEEARDG